MAKVMERLPGDEALIELEAQVRAGDFEAVRLCGFVADLRPEPEGETK